jgi:UDP-N-acetylglucosamine 4-epimerase
VSQLINHESPIINGNGNFSRDFTYIENVIQMNLLALGVDNSKALNTVYNTAFGERATLNELVKTLKQLLGVYDKDILNVEIKYGAVRNGDIPHSLASIDKAKELLHYDPKYSLQDGLQEAIQWYWENLK